MSRVLSGRIRKVGNSLAVIIPKGLLDEAGAKEGDTVRLSIAIPTSRRDSALEAVAGVDRENGLFDERNWTDTDCSSTQALLLKSYGIQNHQTGSN